MEFISKVRIRIAHQKEILNEKEIDSVLLVCCLRY